MPPPMFDANVFWSEIRAETARANELVSHLEELAASGIGGERFDFTRHQLSHFIGRLRLRTLLACDVLAAASFRDEFERGWLPYQADPTKLQLAPWRLVDVLRGDLHDRSVPHSPSSRGGVANDRRSSYVAAHLGYRARAPPAETATTDVRTGARAR